MAAAASARPEREARQRWGRQSAHFPLEELNFMHAYRNVRQPAAERFLLKKIVKPLKFPKIKISRVRAGAK